MTHTVVSINNLTCRYGDFTAVKDLSFEVNQGEIFGFLGPNGAGKTTTLRTMMDFIRPDGGSIEVFGIDTRAEPEAIKARVGFLSSELVLWENWNGEQYIRWLEKVRHKPMLEEAQRLAQLLDFEMKRSLQGMSTGMKRKIGVIAALAHKPELLILDEPSIGLDPLMQQVFEELMIEVREEGRTVLLSSHDLSEVEAICDRVAIIREGELQTVENVANLTRLAFRWMNLTFKDEAAPIEGFDRINGVTDISTENGELRMRVSGDADMDTLIKHIAQYPVKDLQFDHPTLEEIFLTYYGREA
ncbi:MAG: ABC transporter ATP-binding protein [Chloroflexi bacterium]|nr:ABC transporter ATP-binding protein [Chloroflexota bacterium]